MEKVKLRNGAGQMIAKIWILTYHPSPQQSTLLESYPLAAYVNM